MTRSLVWATLVVCLGPTMIEAQTLQRPSRPYRGLFGGGPPPDPSRSRHELSLTASLLVGYDDYLSLGGAPGPVGPDRAAASAYSGFLDTSVNYFVGKSSRSLAVIANTFANAYSAADVDPLIGGALRLTAQTDWGRRSRIEATQNIDYTPSLVLGAFEALQESVEPQVLPENGLGSGLINQRSWASRTGLNFERRWSTRQSTTLNGDYSTRRYLDELGFDTVTRSGGLQHSWNPTRDVTFGASYFVSDSQSDQAAEDAMPLQNHTLETSTTYRRRLSPTRQLTIEGGLGATYVDTLHAVSRQPQSYWTPSGHGTFSVGLGQSWAVAADYHRSVNVLPGVTLQSFSTDAASLRTNGTIGRRIETIISTSFSTGRTAGGDGLARFESYSGMTQLRFAISRCCALSMNYDYYYYRLRDFSSLPAGLPPQYDDNLIRVGFNFWLPLFGTYAAGSEGRSAGGR